MKETMIMGKMEKDEREMICDEGMTMRKEQMTGQTPWKCVGNVQALQPPFDKFHPIMAWIVFKRSRPFQRTEITLFFFSL